MQRTGIIEVPRWLLTVLNQAFEMERKLELHGDNGGVQRNIERLKSVLQEQGLFYENPMGSRFDETRTDVEASISGEGIDNLVIVEVHKPIIRYGDSTYSKVIQKGIVVVKAAANNVPTAEE